MPKQLSQPMEKEMHTTKSLKLPMELITTRLTQKLTKETGMHHHWRQAAWGPLITYYSPSL